ncbi:MAG: N-acetylneuraminate synthase [Flavobacterium sp. BFFFF2]|nr:MAG: N-acetylneuraminate synthase [Flavobacterium sp. BFFFF2]
MNTKPYLIAEIAQAHDGSLGAAHAYIDALAQTGIDAVKWQMHLAEAESSEWEPFRIPFSKQDDSRMAYWQRTSFTFDQWKDIKDHCSQVGLDFICSPFSNWAVDWLEELGVTQYKVGSGEMNNKLLLEKIARTGKPIILSSGMSNWHELDQAVARCQQHDCPVAVLQCTTAYPTQPAQFGLNMLAALRERYGVPVGFSDHSGLVATGIAAVALGAEILEFHVVFDRRQFGPDSVASLTIDETSLLAQSAASIYTALQHPIDKNQTEPFTELKRIFGKSLAINKDVPAGHVLTFDDLETKKPAGYGIPASEYEQVIEKKCRHAMQKWAFLNEDDLL